MLDFHQLASMSFARRARVIRVIRVLSESLMNTSDIFIYILIYFIGRADLFSKQPTGIKSPYITTPRRRFAGSYITDVPDPGFLKVKRVKGSISGAVSFVPENHAEFCAFLAVKVRPGTRMTRIRRIFTDNRIRGHVE